MPRLSDNYWLLVKRRLVSMFVVIADKAHSEMDNNFFCDKNHHQKWNVVFSWYYPDTKGKQSP